MINDEETSFNNRVSLPERERTNLIHGQFSFDYFNDFPLVRTFLDRLPANQVHMLCRQEQISLHHLVNKINQQCSSKKNETNMELAIL